MAWSDLTKTQQDFLIRYLEPRLVDRFLGMGTSERTGVVIDAFEDYETARLAYESALAAIPDDYPERVALAGSMAEAQRARDAGAFTDGAALLREARAEALRTAQVWRDEADRLRGIRRPVIYDESDDERDELDGLHATVSLQGTAGLPPWATIAAAREAEPVLDRRAQEIPPAIAQRKLDGARQAFEDIWLPMKDDAERVAAADITGAWTEFGRHDEMQDLVDRATELCRKAQEAYALDTPDAYDSTALDIDGQGVDYADLDALYTEALTGFRDALKKRRDSLAESVEDALDIDEGDLIEAERLARPGLAKTAKELLDRADDALGKDDPQAMIDADEALATTTVDSELDDIFNAVLLRGKKKKLVGRGIPESALGGLDALFEDSNQSFDATIDILTKTADVLGDREVTPAFLKDLRKDAAEAAKRTVAATKAQGEGKKLHDEAVKALQTARATLKDLKTQLKNATTEEDKTRLTLAVKAAEEEEARLLAAEREKKLALNALNKTLTEREDAQAGADEMLKAAETRKGLLEAITFGPLAPGRVSGLSDDGRADMCRLFGTDPALGRQGADTLLRARDPEAVVVCAQEVNDRMPDRFKHGKTSFTSDASASKFGSDLLSMSANVDKARMERLGPYLDNGGHIKKLPGLTGKMTPAKRGQANVRHVTDGLVGNDGSFDFDGADDRLDDLMFNYYSLMNPQPNLVKHMAKTLEFFETSATAQTQVANMGAPTDPGGQTLVSMATGTRPEDVTEVESRRAVVSGMMTPVTQGKVGSCFSTSNAVRLREVYPDYTLDVMIGMVETGTYTPANGDPVPVVTNLPEDDSPLVRSLEYSGATATARAGNSKEQKKLKGQLKDGLGALSDKFDPSVSDAIPSLVQAVTDGFTFIYDPKAPLLKPSEDGSSKFGRFVLQRADTGAPINSKSEFVAAMRDIIQDAIDEDDLADTVTVEEVVDAAVADGILDRMKKDDSFPWELGSGGQTSEAASVMTGALGGEDSMVPSDSGGTVAPKDRTVAIMKSLLTKVPSGPGSEDLATIRTVGQHGFNATPNDPSLEKLREGGTLEDNIDTLVTNKAQTLKTTAIPTDRAVYMFERAMSDLIQEDPWDLGDVLREAIETHRPTTPLTPDALDALIKTATREYLDQRTDKRVGEWEDGLKKDSKPEPTEEERTKKKEALRKSTGEILENAARNRLMKDLEVPELVIADTNWGGPQDKTFFVIVPDPVSGEPRMFRRVDPPGKLTPLDEKWLKKEWAVVT